MLRAVVRFARDVAQLPSFPRVRETGVETVGDEEADEEASVLRIVATDPIPGQVLPPSDTTWLALLPFQDLHAKHVTPEIRADRVRARRAFVELLVRLAVSPQYGWDAATMQCGEMVGPPRTTNPDNAFWLGLLRALWPEAALDVTQPLERNLIALSRARRPRFLLCLDHDMGGAVDATSLLESFLLPPDDDAPPALYGPTIVDGLPEDDEDGVVVEIGLSFTRGKISLATMTQLLDVIDRVHANRDPSPNSCIRFRVTTLRFGGDCTFQGKALELLGHHRRRASNSVRSIRLGNLNDVRASVRRVFLADLLTRGHSHLHRLATSTHDSFVPVAAAVRSGGASQLQELDVKYAATNENAAWLAFAFFHVDSKSSVSSLCLRAPKSRLDDHAYNAGLTLPWLATFERVLRSVSAERDLAHMEGLLDQQQHRVRTLVRLQPGVVAKSGPSKVTKTVCTLNEAAGEEMELLVRYKSSLAVVIPGAGVGWVPATAVISERTTQSCVGVTDTTSTVPINHRVTSFTWDGAMAPCLTSSTYHHVAALMELLAIIGRPLRSLHLPAMRFSREHLGQILLYCPNLTELNVSGHEFEDIDPLVDSFASGQCRISTLSISRSDDTPTRCNSIAVPMAQILEGNGRGVLRQLVVHSLPTCAPSPISQMAVQRLVEPLAVAVSAPNSKIEYLHLPGVNLHASNTLQLLHSGFAQRPLSFSPMPLRAKLAFLSAVYRFGSARSLGQLDASVLGVIFRFSYDCFARRVLKNAPLRLDACACKTCALRPSSGF
jgi:hypothetical protein